MRKILAEVFTVVLFLSLLAFPLSKKAFAQESENQNEENISDVDQSESSDQAQDESEEPEEQPADEAADSDESAESDTSINSGPPTLCTGHTSISLNSSL